ncbi:MAG TPA: FAD-dependent oxidoreductase [Hyphomicrobiaceae bacterium]|nr:FAD-dependent oxidoreductase [Hyphomicrobiaceae bacterium]
MGAGYTGLSAALQIAKGGRRAVVLEADAVGGGASGPQRRACFKKIPRPLSRRQCTAETRRAAATTSASRLSRRWWN